MVDGDALGPGAEFDLIRRFLERAGTNGPGVLVGPGDDAAVVDASPIVVSTDLSMEGVHFRFDWISPTEAGYRAAAAALSDLAAMAAAPVGFLVSLAVPPAARDVAAELMDGARSAADDLGAALLGGDLGRSPGPAVIDVVVLGTTARPVLRSGARPGDELWVTGRLGGAAAAVVAWRRGETPDPEARAAFAHPRPRIREALWLAEHGTVHALIDLSDGLAGDLRHIAAASRVAVVVDADRVPVHPSAVRVAGERDALRLALGGGEDYEICFAAPAGAVGPLVSRFEREFGVALHHVGAVRVGDGVALRRADGSIEELALSGFQHFEGETG